MEDPNKLTNDLANVTMDAGKIAIEAVAGLLVCAVLVGVGIDRLILYFWK